MSRTRLLLQPNKDDIRNGRLEFNVAYVEAVVLKIVVAPLFIGMFC